METCDIHLSINMPSHSNKTSIAFTFQSNIGSETMGDFHDTGPSSDFSLKVTLHYTGVNVFLTFTPLLEIALKAIDHEQYDLCHYSGFQQWLSVTQGKKKSMLFIGGWIPAAAFICAALRPAVFMWVCF